MRKPTRLGTDSGHKMDFLVRKERLAAGEPRAHPVDDSIQTGGMPEELPYRRGGHYGKGSGGVKKAQRKGLRRSEKMEDHASAGGVAERWRHR